MTNPMVVSVKVAKAPDGTRLHFVSVKERRGAGVYLSTATSTDARAAVALARKSLDDQYRARKGLPPTDPPTPPDDEEPPW